MMKYIFLSAFIISSICVSSQRTYWQQRANYTMEVEMDVKKNTFNGTQKLIYTNNSPDTLKKAYYHLYFNAFQPGSMMDVRSRTISDPDGRVQDRISKLKPEEEGHLHVSDLKQDGKKVVFAEEGTILAVRLEKPILPGESSTFEMTFNGQVPLQIRRSGRDNEEGIRYSMSQWYPKMSEYDYKGWHPNPYIGREFYGIWGDFDVKITIDSDYILGGTGYVQNPNQVGHGYEEDGAKVKSSKGKTTWHFKAPNVHDFMWAADPDFKHVKKQVPGGPMLHFLYQDTSETRDWLMLPDLTVKSFQFMSKTFGEYPYEQFSVIQGGDGGMEYPMSTLITGHRKLGSLLSVTVHEAFHSWYHGVLGTNESLYPWMDEGFTSYAQDVTLREVLNADNEADPHRGSYRNYIRNATSGNEEPLTTHADHYSTNRSYGINSYSKGAVFLHQLSYIVGQENLMVGMRRYYNTWKFRHPTPEDFIRVMEKVSDMELDWYLEYFVNSTKQIDYSVGSVESIDGNKTAITLSRDKEMIMPIDLYVTDNSGKEWIYTIPLRIMRGEKSSEWPEANHQVSEDWPWVNPEYTLTIDLPKEQIKSIEIDASNRLADVNRSNNKVELK